MKSVRLVVTLLAAGTLSLSPLPADAQAAAPTHSVVRFFKCARQGEAVRDFQRGSEVVQEMIGEGKFLDHGVLAHAWGDEWNVVDYFIVSGLPAFFGNFQELGRRIGERDPELMTRLLQNCTEHKDVIYAVVPPPTP